MTDFSNNGYGATDNPPAAKPKTARKAPDPTPTTQQDSMADDYTSTTASPASSQSESEESSRLRATLQKIEARADELRRWGSERQEMAREVVEERPLVVVGAAFGVGLLIGLLSARL